MLESSILKSSELVLDETQGNTENSRPTSFSIQSREISIQEKFEGDSKVSAEVATYLTNAQLLMKHGENALALNILRQACNIDSHNPHTLDLLAQCLENANKLSEAAIARKALVSVDYGFDSIFKQAQLFYKMNNDEQALAKYYDALSLITEENEHLFEVYKNMGNIFVRQGDFEAAEEKYSKAYTLNSESDVLLVNFGTLEVQRNDFDKSLHCFRQAIEVNCENDRAWVGLAMVHNHFGDGDLAWANLETALDINPKNRTAVHLLANWSVRDSKIGKGIQALESYLAQGDVDEDMSLVLINLYCTQGDIEKAQLEIERVLLWNPDHVEVRKLRKQLRHTRVAA